VSLNLFKAVDGLCFFVGDQACVLGAGRYAPDGRGALWVDSAMGEHLDKLTVNLPDEPCGEDEFFVKDSDLGRTAKALRAVLLKLGLFEAIEGYVSAGFVDHYAERWRFAKMFPARCGNDYRALDLDLRRVLDDAYKAKREELLAQDAERRLDVPHRRFSGRFA
jgi:hypothetical protein